MHNLSYIKALCSPFKPFKLKWYFGKIAVGTPIFFPRKWVKDPNKPGYTIAKPKKIGFDVVGLGWKTKWDDTDYRFEWAPVFSFVFFKWQIAARVVVNAPNEYWSAWLYYERNTDHSLSKSERIQQCKKNFPLTYKVYNKIEGKESEEIVDYYNLILKPKYK